MSRPRLLDAFCRAGGAGEGYHRAGFDVTGIDIEDMTGVYPHKFIQGNAIDYIREHGHEFDVIHASPPCQAGSALTKGTNKGRVYAYDAEQHQAQASHTRAVRAAGDCEPLFDVPT